MNRRLKSIVEKSALLSTALISLCAVGSNATPSIVNARRRPKRTVQTHANNSDSAYEKYEPQVANTMLHNEGVHDRVVSDGHVGDSDNSKPIQWFNSTSDFTSINELGALMNDTNNNKFEDKINNMLTNSDVAKPEDSNVYLHGYYLWSKPKYKRNKRLIAGKATIKRLEDNYVPVKVLKADYNGYSHVKVGNLTGWIDVNSPYIGLNRPEMIKNRNLGLAMDDLVDKGFDSVNKYSNQISRILVRTAYRINKSHHITRYDRAQLNKVRSINNNEFAKNYVLSRYFEDNSLSSIKDISNRAISSFIKHASKGKIPMNKDEGKYRKANYYNLNRGSKDISSFLRNN